MDNNNSLDFQQHAFTPNLRRRAAQVDSLKPSFFTAFMADNSLETELEKLVEPLRTLLLDDQDLA